MTDVPGTLTGSTPEAVFGVASLNTSKYRFLDLNNMQVKTRNAHDLVAEQLSLMKVDNDSIIQTYPIRNMEATIGPNHYPGWRLDHVESAGGPFYIIDVYTVKGEKAFQLSIATPTLLVPEYLPIAQRMIDSFQFTQ